MKKTTPLLLVALVLAVALVPSQAVAQPQKKADKPGESGGGLVDSLAKTGIDRGQAENAAGAMMDLAGSKLSKEDFGKLSESMPEIAGIREKTGFEGKVNNVPSLMRNLKTQGIDASKFKELVPVLKEYVQEKAGPVLADKVQAALQGSGPGR
ncbi:MAG: hypothetical protein EP299_02250 [Acidobacteria bacterium]|nr:MAG: hypothetical protein EP299_02250 [Acidobacteriota bacterium]